MSLLLALPGLKYGGYTPSASATFADMDFFKFETPLHAQVGAHKRSYLEHVRRALLRAVLLIFLEIFLRFTFSPIYG